MAVFVNASFLSIHPMTGLSRYALAMSLALQQELGTQVIFLTPRNVRPIAELDRLNIEYVGPPRKWLIWEQYDLPFYLKRIGNPLLINFGNTAPLWYSNQIVTILDVFYHHVKNIAGSEQSAYPWRDIQFYKVMAKQIAHRSRQVITISEYSKQDIIRTLGISTDKVEVVYPTVSDLFLQHSTDLPTQQTAADYILGVSSITPHKNFGSLITAYQRANLTNTRLVIAGNMPGNSVFSSFKDGQVSFTGFVDDIQLKALYQHAKFFVYPSKFEGFGIPPLEAMACGCPTLVSNVASIPEVCGKASHYIDPYDIDDMTRGLRELDADAPLREHLIANGYKQLPRYDKHKSTRRLINILERHLQ